MEVDMTNEEQNVAVAKWMGWELDLAPYGPYTKKGDKNLYTSWPDYGQDLNAMHVAWLKLDSVKLRLSFDRNIIEIVRRRCRTATRDDLLSVVINAECGERREALLRTIGKWKDSQNEIDRRDLIAGNTPNRYGK